MSAPRNSAERAYALLLVTYPAEFRERFGRQLEQAFRDLYRESDTRRAKLWFDVLWDVARSAPALRVEALHSWWSTNTPVEDGTMRPMAILTVVVGAIQILNALVELGAGWSQPHGDYWLAGVMVGLMAAALLIAAGVSLLRGVARAAAWARIGALACVAMVVFIWLVQPWMSIFGILLGIGFPIVLLLFLQLGRGQGPSSTARA
jgi:hypothetical protein